MGGRRAADGADQHRDEHQDVQQPAQVLELVESAHGLAFRVRQNPDTHQRPAPNVLAPETSVWVTLRLNLSQVYDDERAVAVHQRSETVAGGRLGRGLVGWL